MRAGVCVASSKSPNSAENEQFPYLRIRSFHLCQLFQHDLHLSSTLSSVTSRICHMQCNHLIGLNCHSNRSYFNALGFHNLPSSPPALPIPMILAPSPQVLRIMAAKSLRGCPMHNRLFSSCQTGSHPAGEQALWASYY